MSRPSTVLAFATVLALVACQKKEEAAPMMDEAAPAPVSERAENASGGASADRMASVAVPSPSIGTAAPERQFVRSAELRFRTRSVEEATRSIEAIVARVGGFVASNDLRSSKDFEHRESFGRDSVLEVGRVEITNTMQLRVPNDQLDTVLARVGVLAAFLDYRTVRAQDVGMELRRAERERRRMEKASKRVQDLAAESGRLRDRAQIDEQALQREDRAEAAESQLDDLQGQVQLSTVDLVMYQHPVTRVDTLERPLYESWREPLWKRLGSAWSDGWDGFVSLVLWMVSHWIWIALVAAAVVLFLRRRRSEKPPVD